MTDNTDRPTIPAMAAALEREGWRYLRSPHSLGGFWLHDDWGQVTNGGGEFASYAAATVATFNSATRAMSLGGAP